MKLSLFFFYIFFVISHAKAMELGGTCEGPPGFRGPEELGFYAAYFRDLDDNKLVVASFGGG